MTTALLTVNAILLIYAIWAIASPKTALFFIPNKANRKRWPGSFIVAGVWIVFFIIAGPIVQNSPETLKQKEEERLEAEAQAQKEAEERAHAVSDSILRARIDALELDAKHGALNTDGPTNEIWRYQQWLFAERDSINLKWVDHTLNDKFSVENGSELFSQIDNILKSAATSTWQNRSYSGYYDNPAQYGDSVIAKDGITLQRLMDSNKSEALRLNKKFIKMIKID